MLDRLGSVNNMWRLDACKDMLGVSCGEQGPRVGTVQLLRRDASGWKPRAPAELNEILRPITLYPIDFMTRVGGLQAVARAMNEGDLVRAIICTLHMRLPPLPDTDAAFLAMRKDPPIPSTGSPFEILHPRWEAGATDGRGGQFRPKTEAEKLKSPGLKTFRRASRAAMINALREAQDMIEQLEMHQEGLATLPNDFMHEKLKTIPNALLLDDLGLLAADLQDMKIEIEAARKFAEGGPRTIDELRVSPGDEGFDSMDAFKKSDDDFAFDLEKRFGNAPPGYEYHHNVEQTPNVDNFAARILHNTQNIFLLPKLFHQAVSGAYSSVPSKGAPTVRQTVSAMPHEEQRKHGHTVLRRLGILRK